MRSQTWSEKYRPKNFMEMRGQVEAVESAKKFIGEYNLGKITKTKKKALILYGGPGTGKTTLAHVIAKENNSEIFELNASDLRNKSSLNEVLKPALEQQSLLSKNKIILVDEVDGISGTDRGGITTLLMLIETSSYPVIMTANDVWSKKLAPLRKKCELANLKDINNFTIKEILINILRKEDAFIPSDILTNISINARGDLRAAINDIQTISNLKDYSEFEIDGRNKEKDIFQSMKKIFHENPSNDLLREFDSVNMSLDEIILWMEKNVPSDYQGKELAKAFEAISKADLFKGRIYRKQYWRFLVYENIFLSYGIAAAKKKSKSGFTNYKKPTRILKIWMNNQKTAKKKSIAEKYAKAVHVGTKRAMNEFYIIKNIIKSNPNIQKQLKLTEDELVYLKD